MKGLRFLIIMVAVVLAFSAWAPSPAYAKPAETQATIGVSTTVDFCKTKTGSLSVTNKTKGTLYVSLSGPAFYSFSTSKQGKTTFKNIMPGTYTITVRASACGGSLTYNKKIKGNASLKTFVCRKK
jgi:hypothetical protein